MQAHIVHAPATATSSTCMLDWWCRFSRAPRASCRCLPFYLKKMAAVSVTVFEENKVLCRGRLLRVNDVDTSLLLMLQGFLSTFEASEFVAGRLHSVSTASAEGIRLDAVPDDKVPLHMEFGRHHVFFNLRCSSHSEDADPTA